MISNQHLGARLPGLLALALGLASGCSSHHAVQRTESASSAQAEPAAQSSPAPEMTATEAAIAGDNSATPQAGDAQAAATSGPAINPTAPKTYTVKRGDTLWGIATMFLRDPWLWPEVWYVNPQVQNPHLIYPGDVLALAYGADGKPQIRLERGGEARLSPRLRDTPLDNAIPALPYSEIAAFLSKPSVIMKEDLDKAPHVIAFRDSHVIGGAGMDVYVRGLKDEAQNARYNVMHVGDPIRDPDAHRIIGYQGIYSATALITKPGDPAKAALTDSARETLTGDRLFTATSDAPLSFVPSAPKGEIQGRIVSVIDGVNLVGQYQIVIINRGQRDGLEVGNFLAIDQAGEVVRDTASSRWGMGTTFAPRVKMPDERAGTLLVFKTYDKLSYGLIVGASNPIRVADVVRSP